jgi:hypothetical protein
LKETLAASVPQTASKGGSETILLVEDDVDIRELVAAMLQATRF